MIKCIFTNIKNEHRYIEEWLEYHIRLGINKFIIYEDEGSESHEDIINKYNKVVDIDFYDYILKKDSDEFKDLTCFKHIKENYNNIDWLIKIDPDEYISLPQNMTIDDLLYGIPKNINQIRFNWKLYNANGLINEPSHGKYNVVDTYIDPIDFEKLATYFTNNVSINKYRLGKSFIRYKWFINSGKDLFQSFPHAFIDLAENTMFATTFNGYLNHYITKSFEEFYNKLTQKGEYNKQFYRKLGDFFVLNPDMISKIPYIESKFDIDIFSIETKLN